MIYTLALIELLAKINDLLRLERWPDTLDSLKIHLSHVDHYTMLGATAVSNRTSGTDHCSAAILCACMQIAIRAAVRIGKLTR